jgi:acetyltransferase-like isoleucine patch superfamily enzyme
MYAWPIDNREPITGASIACNKSLTFLNGDSIVNFVPSDPHEMTSTAPRLIPDRSRRLAPMIGSPGFTITDLSGVKWVKVEDARNNWIGCHGSQDPSALTDKITFLGDATDNVIVLSPSHLYRITLHVSGSRNIALMGSSALWQSRLMVAFKGNDNLFFIGDRCAVNDAHATLTCDGCCIVIGDNCMLSSGVTIRTHDEHGIVDMRTGEWLNPPKNVIVEPHVWIGSGATVRMGTKIGFGSIVGERSVVTRDVERYTAVAGVPARMIRRDISWCTHRAAGAQVMMELREFERSL